jgi:glycosyltransferase involved in cell wall biosynthesis
LIRVALDMDHSRQSAAGTVRVARALSAALRRRDDVEVLELGGGPLVPRGTFRKRLTTLRQDFWWYPYAGRRSARRRRADVYHCPTPRAPLSRGSPPLVVTIYDLLSIRFPDTMTRWSRLHERATLRRVTRAANRIVVACTDTANDLQLLLGVPASKIRVVPCAVDDFFFGNDSASGRPLDAPYVLFVGTPQPRKNLDRLTRAVHLLRGRGYPHQLVVVGAFGWGEVNLGEGIHQLGHVSDEELRRLYAHADCLAIPSLHEGFGLPAVEAMAAGTPVVAARVGALPEVTAGAAVLVDPYEVESIAEGIVEATRRRDDLIPRGLKRARELTWAATAEQMVAVYRELARGA